MLCSIWFTSSHIAAVKGSCLRVFDAAKGSIGNNVINAYINCVPLLVLAYSLSLNGFFGRHNALFLVNINLQDNECLPLDLPRVTEKD